MKGFAGGNLLSDETSPFGVALTPVQCIHYALEQKGVSSIFVGVKTPDELMESLKYCGASDEEKDYSQVLYLVFLHFCQIHILRFMVTCIQYWLFLQKGRRRPEFGRRLLFSCMETE